MVTPVGGTACDISVRLVCRTWRDDYDGRIAAMRPQLVALFRTMMDGDLRGISFESSYRLVYTECMASSRGVESVLLSLRWTAVMTRHHMSDDENMHQRTLALADICSFIAFRRRRFTVTNRDLVRLIRSFLLFETHTTTPYQT